jgi:chromosome segregation ATPase
MLNSSIWRITAMLIVLGAAAFSAAGQQDPSQQPSGDPVADAARKARAQQQKEAKPKKVFTNDDIPSAAVSAPAPASSGGTQSTEPLTGKKEQAAEDKDKEKDKKGEAYWRGRFKEAHKKLAEAQQELDILQREVNKDQVQYYSDPQKALMQQYNRSDINEKNAKIDAKKKEIEALNQKLSDMEDELRKAGGDPGWAR